jgi:radical SAM superfamily enzyme YgiQ (UPF0313 family)
MRFLLINANTFSDPPCIPIGVEYAASALRRHGHTVGVCDLWPHPSPMEELIRRLNAETYDMAGVSFRNLDTAQAARYINFAPHVRKIVDTLHTHNLPVVLGGTGFQAMPREVLAYTGADFGIDGPADTALPQLVQQFDASRDAWLGAPPDARIVNAHPIGIEPDAVPERAVDIYYPSYIAKGSVVGFATQFGCPEQCDYCVEAGTRFCTRQPRAVVAELKALCAKGFDDYHLCDSEFNIDINHCHGVLDAMAAAGLKMRWALYMKPAPCDAALLDGLQRTGAYLATVSVESAAIARGRYAWDDVAFILCGLRERGIKAAVDLTVGLPDEEIGSVRRAIDFFRTERPDKVNVNAFLRVYGGTRLESMLRTRADLRAHLTEELPDGPPLFRLFYNQLPLEELKIMLGEDPMFKLEGFDHGTNYEILKD